MEEQNVKAAVDAVAVVTTVGTMMSYLPPLASLFTIIWTGMRIIEMVTGKPFSEIIGRKK